MTIALIGKENVTRTSARVALVSVRGSDFISEIERGRHEAIYFDTWQQFEQREGAGTFDLVLCDEDVRSDVPDRIGQPVICVDDSLESASGFANVLAEMGVNLSMQIDRVQQLEAIVEGIRTGDAMVGATPPMRRLNSAVSRAADCDATVLIEGPVGSGKSLAARAIHLKSRRSEREIAVHDCATLSGDELTRKLMDCAATTLVLESVDQLPAAAQTVLVKHLKERSTSRAPSLTRLIATTSAHVPELVARGSFREDLFYRLHAFPVMVPGLNERVDDIQMLADSILDSGVPASGRNHQGFTPAARMLLESMQWPGHIAQLEATIRRGQMLAGGAAIDREHLMAPAASQVPNAAAASTTGNVVAETVELTEESIRPFEEEEKFLLGRALQATKGNVRRAAQLLGIGRATLYRKIQQYDLRLH
ncbi:MAG: sigma-54-dependent transcriptional regulator [Planctomycetota bacterium]